MKKLVLPFITLVVALFTLFTYSCQKTTHPLYSAPSNARVKSFTKVGSDTLSLTLTENYTFSYDASNRLSKIIYTKNDTPAVNEVIYFTYSNDSIFKNYTLTNSVITTTDTFVKNASGQIISTNNFTLFSNTYAYYGALLSRYTDDSARTTLYQSYSGDIIKSTNSSLRDENRSYYYNTGLPNRIGDFLQINSFATYGYNFWQNAHLIKTITDPSGTTQVTYVIDDQNKITQTTAVKTDSTGLIHTDIYSLQWETF